MADVYAPISCVPEKGPFALLLQLLGAKNLQLIVLIHGIINRAATKHLDGSVVFSAQHDKVLPIYNELVNAMPKHFDVSEDKKLEIRNQLLLIVKNIHRNRIRYHWLKENPSVERDFDDMKTYDVFSNTGAEEVVWQKAATPVKIPSQTPKSRNAKMKPSLQHHDGLQPQNSSNYPCARINARKYIALECASGLAVFDFLASEGSTSAHRVASFLFLSDGLRGTEVARLRKRGRLLGIDVHPVDILKPLTGPLSKFLKMFSIRDLGDSIRVHGLINQAATKHLDGSVVFSQQYDKVETVYSELKVAMSATFKLSENRRRDAMKYLQDVLKNIHRNRIRYHWLKANSRGESDIVDTDTEDDDVPFHDSADSDDTMIRIGDREPSSFADASSVRQGGRNPRRSGRLAQETESASRGTAPSSSSSHGPVKKNNAGTAKKVGQAGDARKGGLVVIRTHQNRAAGTLPASRAPQKKESEIVVQENGDLDEEAFIALHDSAFLPAFDVLKAEGYASASRVASFVSLPDGFRGTEVSRLVRQGELMGKDVHAVDFFTVMTLLTYFYDGEKSLL
ncbi:hypothetical protein CVT24_006041 [Panaeolus cyanescens]|uniref:Uncharacterized protein n=1 Tax=Panaeolus cyanescens TaxID=181874 RepID=A0A409YDX2_9AGAR|nr:hypothetical protein CVT24_006041 [Panaeolus cyanescens]